MITVTTRGRPAGVSLAEEEARLVATAEVNIVPGEVDAPGMTVGASTATIAVACLAMRALWGQRA